MSLSNLDLGLQSFPHVAYLYPVGLHGVQDVVRISCVKGGASDCPGLIGPSEMSRWKVVMKFAEKLIAIQGKEKPMMLTSTRHPAINLLDYGEGVKKGENFWKQHDIQELVKTLEGNPHAWAFLNHNAEAEESEASEETEAEEEKESDASGGGIRRGKIKGGREEHWNDLSEIYKSCRCWRSMRTKEKKKRTGSWSKHRVMRRSPSHLMSLELIEALSRQKRTKMNRRILKREFGHRRS